MPHTVRPAHPGVPPWWVPPFPRVLKNPLQHNEQLTEKPHRPPPSHPCIFLTADSPSPSRSPSRGQGVTVPERHLVVCLCFTPPSSSNPPSNPIPNFPSACEFAENRLKRIYQIYQKKSFEKSIKIYKSRVPYFAGIFGGGLNRPDSVASLTHGFHPPCSSLKIFSKFSQPVNSPDPSSESPESIPMLHPSDPLHTARARAGAPAKAL